MSWQGVAGCGVHAAGCRSFNPVPPLISQDNSAMIRKPKAISGEHIILAARKINIELPESKHADITDDLT